MKLKKKISILICILMTFSLFFQNNVFSIVNADDKEDDKVIISILSGIEDGNVMVVGNYAVLQIENGDVSRCSSDKPAIIQVVSTDEVNNTVTIKANVAGEAIITVSNSDDTDKASITLYSVDRLNINPSQVTINKGDSYQLTTVKTSNEKIEWSSSDEKKVKVDADGLITGVDVTTTPVTITVTQVVNDIVKTATCLVTVNQPVVKITLYPEEKVIYTDEGGFQISATVIGANSTTPSNSKLIWASSDESIATVSQRGYVTLTRSSGVVQYKTGSLAITVHSEDGNITAACNVTVKNRATRVKLSENYKEVNLTQGQFQLIPTIYPNDDDAINKELSWSSTNENVATVDKTGMVTLRSSGETTITAICKENQEANDSCVVIVNVPVKSISLDYSNYTLSVGDTFKLTHKLEPDNASNTKVEWTSTDTSVATVDDEGNVTAIAGGEATIIVKSVAGDDKSSQAACVVNVLENVSSVKLSKSKIYLSKGSYQYLDAYIAPATATNQNVTWSSSREEIATVDENGKVIAVSLGTAVIIARSTSGETATCIVEVTNDVKSLYLSETKRTLYINDEYDSNFKLTYTTVPEEITGAKEIWSSTDENVAIVDDKGNVTAIGNGTTIISLKIQNETSSKTRKCTVTVKEYVSKITLNKKKANIKKGKTVKLVAKVLNETATKKSLKWESSNTSVATVNKNGKVTAKKKGKATITCIALDNSGVKATCTIKVKK